MELCQLSKLYISYLMNYTKILNQRNNLLKYLAMTATLLETLDIWDAQLVRYGSFLFVKQNLFQSLMHLLEIFTANQSGDLQESACHRISASAGEEDYGKRLFSKRSYDIKTRTTSAGRIGTISVFLIWRYAVFLSFRGQQRQLDFL